VAASGVAAGVVLAAAFFLPGRLRQLLAGFRFTSTLLAALAVMAILGTLVLQGQPEAFYRDRYGGAALLILAFRLDDLFHGLPFAALMALFAAAVLASASLRLHAAGRNAGFLVCHLGLIASLGGAAASATLSVRGQIDLNAGQTTGLIRVTKGAAHRPGSLAALPFTLTLDRFELVRHESEYRVGLYERTDEDAGGPRWRLRASFTPDGARHVLPGGATFQLTGNTPDHRGRLVATPAASGGVPALLATIEGERRWLAAGQAWSTPDGRTAIAFDWKRPAPPQGVLTAFLVSGEERKVILHTADGEAEVPLTDGLALAGGAVRVERFLPQASLAEDVGPLSQSWDERPWIEPAVAVRVQDGGRVEEKVLAANEPSAIAAGPGQLLAFERREGEAKAFASSVTVRHDGEARRAVIRVNEPLTFQGWTLYQMNYREEDPTYSGLEAVHDPGVPWVFTGFALICIGVAAMFYVEPRLRARRRALPPPTAPAQAA
jgi:hypothetical protein